MARSPEFEGMLQEEPAVTNAVLTSLLESSRDCVKLLDLEGRLLYVNRVGLSVRQMAGAEDVLGRYCWEFWPSEAEATLREAISIAGAGKKWEFRGLCPSPKGTDKWWDVRVSPVTDVAGKPILILVVSRDVTDAVTHRTMYETIALEMRHRLKNAFAVSSAITKISARSAPAHQSFAEDLVNRFSSLAVAQSRLVDAAEDFSLRELVSDVVGAAGVHQGAFDVSQLPDCRIDESQMRTIAIVIGELATNSLKYGALGSGRSAACEGRIEGGWLSLLWTESLAGLVHEETGKASSSDAGLHVMNRIVLSAGGSINRETTTESLIVSFSIPHPEPGHETETSPPK
jgi:PAS domain S-box-containing protein